MSKSISELEDWKWREEVPSENDSYVVRNFYRLHSLPLKDYNLGDIRFMLGQETGLEYLVPIALDQLKSNVFIEADLYPGDLLCSLLLINDDSNYWKTHPKEKQELIDLYTEQKKALGSLDVTEEVIKKIKEAYKEFLDK